MEGRNRRRRIWVLGFVALILAAVVVLYLTAPPPTVLLVRALDAGTGAPLVGAQVQIQQPGQSPLPAVFTDESGTARFMHPPPDPGYRVQVQKVDYLLARQTGVPVPESQETEVTVQLESQPGGRLFVGLGHGRLTEIDTASLRVVQTLVLGAAPEAPVRYVRIHPKENLVYVVAGARLLILSANGALLAEADTGGTVDSLDVSADGAYLLLTGTSAEDASAIVAQRQAWTFDAHSGHLVEEAWLSRAEAMAGQGLFWQPDGTDVDALRLASPVVRDMPVRGQTTVGLSRMPTAANRSPARAILSPEGAYLYTWQPGWVSVDTGRLSDALLLIDTVDAASVYQEMSPGVSGLALSPAGDELYALNAKLGTMTFISLTGSRPQMVVPVGKEPQAITISADGQWAYVADGEGQAVIVVDLPSATIRHIIPLLGEPLSLAVASFQ
ncbi:MAG: carboxypeptidase regulatory-like domain-containing protein [Anaerolineae bacterium]